MRSVTIGMFALAAYVCAQTPQAYPLESLRVTGAERIKTERILSVAGLKIGQTVTKANFDAARERLLATGAFENVGYQYKPSARKTGYDATLEVMEVLQMFPFRFEDLPAPETALREAIAKQEPLFEDVIPLIPPVTDRYAQVLATAAGVQKVHGYLRYTAAGEGSIVFRPPSDALHISEVHFTGNDVLTAEQLNSKMILAAYGTEYTEAQTRALLDSAIRPLYEAKGRLRVTFSKITAVPTSEPEVTGVAVTVQVVEGPEYKLGAVKFDGVAPKQVKEMESLADFKKDETANFAEIEKSLDRIRKRYTGTGYLHVTASTERTVNDQAHVVDLTVKVNPGPLFTYGKLNIQGLDILSEPPIRKMWGDRQGKPFDPTSPDAFLKEIREQGLFDNLAETKSQTKLDEASKTAEVTLIFKGGAPVIEKPRRGRGL